MKCWHSFLRPKLMTVCVVLASLGSHSLGIRRRFGRNEIDCCIPNLGMITSTIATSPEEISSSLDRQNQRVDRSTQTLCLNAYLTVRKALSITAPPKCEVFLGFRIGKIIIEHTVDHRFSR